MLVCTDAVFSGKVEGDELTVTGLGNFVTEIAGTGRTVNISSLTLGGADKGNYTLAASGQQTQTTASIAPKDITVIITPNGGTFGNVTAATAQLVGTVDGNDPEVTLTYTATGYNSQAVPVNAGTYTVTATITNGNYRLTGTTIADFLVAKATVDAPVIADLVYSGAQQRPTVSDTNQYTVSENEGGINVGEYQVKLTLKSANYKWADSDEAVKVLTYRITEIELQASEATLSADLTYNGEAQEPTIVVTNGSATLSADIHYTVSYEKIGADSTATAISGKPVDAGAYNAVITGKDNFGGTVKLPFEIDPCTAITVTPDTLQDATYTGSAITPAVTVKGVQNAVLVKDQDYTVAYSSNINAGTATVTISGIGNYDGAEVTRTFKIDPKTLTSENVTVDPVVVTYVADQTNVPAVTVKDGTKTLVAGTDYVIAYKDSSGSPVAAPNAVGSYTAEIVGIADVSEDGSGNYAGLITKTFYITDVLDKIAAMPDPAKTLPDNAAAIATYDAALAAYNALPQELRDSHVGTENKTKLDAMGKALTAYDIVSRTGTWYVRGSGKTLTFTGNGYYAALDSYTQGAYGKFLRVELDGKTLDPKYYDAKAGSTIITLKSSCLDTLSTGKHSIKLIYTDGSTDGADVFRVYIGNGIPLTGDTTDLVMLSGTAIAAAMCIALLLVFTPWKKGKYLR